MIISLFNQQKNLPLSIKNAKAIVKETLEYLDVNCLGLSISFVTKAKISKLHQQFFNDPSLTDCITLPFDIEDSEHRFLGEAFICPYVALEYTEENGGDPYTEVTFYMMHVILHLLGWEDTTSKSRNKMFKKQDELMKHLQSKNLLLRELQN